MKWFLMVCAISGGIGVALASCGPEKAFCPTTNPDQSDLSCHPNLDAMATGGEMGSLCDGSAEYVCQGRHQCTPCQ